MSVVNTLLKQIVIMFILMFTGYALYKKKLLSNQGSKDLGKILLYLVIPIVIIKNFIVERTAENVKALLFSFAISVLIMFISILIAYVVYGKKDGISCFSSAFANSGFVGIPLVTATLGSDAVFYVSMVVVLINTLQWTVGVFIMTKDKNVISPKNIITNPIVVAAIIGVAFFVLQIKLPSIVVESMNTIAATNTPIAMIVSGAYLAQSDLKKMLLNKENYLVSVVRLIVIPLTCILIFKIIPIIDVRIVLAVLIATSTPVGSNVAIYAQNYNLDYKKAIEHVCVSTILSFVTLPFVVYIATMWI